MPNSSSNGERHGKYVGTLVDFGDRGHGFVELNNGLCFSFDGKVCHPDENPDGFDAIVPFNILKEALRYFLTKNGRVTLEAANAAIEKLWPRNRESLDPDSDIGTPNGIEIFFDTSVRRRHGADKNSVTAFNISFADPEWIADLQREILVEEDIALEKVLREQSSLPPLEFSGTVGRLDISGPYTFIRIDDGKYNGQEVYLHASIAGSAFAVYRTGMRVTCDVQADQDDGRLFVSEIRLAPQNPAAAPNEVITTSEPVRPAAAASEVTANTTPPPAVAPVSDEPDGDFPTKPTKGYEPVTITIGPHRIRAYVRVNKDGTRVLRWEDPRRKPKAEPKP